MGDGRMGRVLAMGANACMVTVFKRRAVWLAAAGVLAGSLVACGKPDADHPNQGGPTPKEMVIKVATTDSVSSLDPAGPYDIGSRTLQANLYQSLLTDRKSTRLNSSHPSKSRMPSSA